MRLLVAKLAFTVSLIKLIQMKEKEEQDRYMLAVFTETLEGKGYSDTGL